MESETPDTFTHQLVTAEAVEDCKCGGSHKEGYALWGGVVHPDNIEGGIDPRETIGDLHDGELVYRKA